MKVFFCLYTCYESVVVDFLTCYENVVLDFLHVMKMFLLTFYLLRKCCC